MATQSWSTTIDNNTDAGFRAWVADYIAKLIAVGCTQTADTGQINTATVTRPGTASTVAGYAVFALNDALHGTYPIVFKLEFGTGDASPIGPMMWITVGTGSNGSGTITGQASSRLGVGTTSVTLNTMAVATASYFVKVDGHLLACFHAGWTFANCTMSFSITRFSDDDATPNGDGFTVKTVTAVSPPVIPIPTVQAVRTASPATTFAVNTGGHFAIWPHGMTGTSLDENGDLQAIPIVTQTKKIQQEFAMVSYLNSDVAQGATFTLTVKGVSRTMLALGQAFGYGGLSAGGDQCLATIWE